MDHHGSNACGTLVLVIALSGCISVGEGNGGGGGSGGDANSMDSSVSSTGGRQAATGGRMSSTGGSDTPTAGSGGTPDSPPPFQPTWQACTAAQDCVFLHNEGCCGCSLVGVNVEFEQQARESFPPFSGNCGGLGCASPPCPIDPIAACAQGVCQALPGCSERPLDSCDADGKCRVYSARNCQSPGEPFTPQRCGLPPETEPCSPEPTCRVDPAGLMLLFEDACVPALGYAQPCPIACD